MKQLVCGFLLITTFISCSTSINEAHNSVSKQKFISKNIENREKMKSFQAKGSYMRNAGSIGFWSIGRKSMPVFNFTAQLPVKTALPTGESISYPTDPFFLIGNYRLNAFVHASGGYQLMSMERAIARLNSTGSIDSAYCISVFKSKGKSISLTGLSSDLATSEYTNKSFGIGYAQFKYPTTDNITITRTISSVPSAKVNEGCSALLLSVDIANMGTQTESFTYIEGLNACYQMAIWNNPPFRNKRADYEVVTTIDKVNNRVVAEFIPKEKMPLVVGNTRKEHALADGFPPKVFIQAIPVDNLKTHVEAKQLNVKTAEIKGVFQGDIEAGNKVKLNFVVGYLQDDGDYTIDDLVQQLAGGMDVAATAIPFREEWRSVVPDFEGEKNIDYKLEMQWNVGVLEAMANYNEYYEETYIPQGNLYEYGVGVSAAICDHMVHSLPVNYFNPGLAKSIQRFTLKHANFRGNIYASDEGAGRMPLGAGLKSNSYTYQLMALAEYFKVTGDAEFLTEELPFFGMDYARKGTVLDRIERIFLFCRDEVSVGPHNIPRLLNSDWNDCFYHLFKEEGYHHIFSVAESQMNAAMLSLYLENLALELEKFNGHPSLVEYDEKLTTLVLAMKQYRKEIFDAMVKDMGDRDYLSRAYIGDKLIGDDNIFLEPQIFAVGIKDLGMKKRKAIWNSVKTRLWNMENKGARQNERGVYTNFEDAIPGSRENGGFWFSLNGPLMVNIIDIDKEAAQQCFHNMTMMQHAEDYPNYWVGMWSGPDSFDSSLLPTDGITNKYLFSFPVYCAHTHAWTLWGYYRLRD